MESSTLELITIILSSIIGIGAIIWGTIKIIQTSSNSAKRDAIDEVIKIKKDYDSKFYNLDERVTELDRWRKEMNGQLKLINANLATTNSILIEQKEQLQLMVTSLNSVTVTMAVIGESIKNIKQSDERHEEWIKKVENKIDKLT